MASGAFIADPTTGATRELQPRAAPRGVRSKADVGKGAVPDHARQLARMTSLSGSFRVVLVQIDHPTRNIGQLFMCNLADLAVQLTVGYWMALCFSSAYLLG
jgi:hypothetical protein